MKRIHHSKKNGAIFVVDMDKALLNVDKNNIMIKTNHRNLENQINILPIYEKKRSKSTKQKHSQ